MTKPTKAGRELDALVHMAIFGFKHGDTYATTHVWGQVPKYSTEISAAFEVGKKVGGCWGLQYGPARKEWTANFCVMMGAPTFRESDRNPAVAICVAALKAVGGMKNEH